MMKIRKSSWIVYDCDAFLKCHEKFVMDHHVSCSGIDALNLELSSIVEGEFFIKFHLRNKSDDFKWILMAVYGPAQDDFKPAFLAELVRTCQQNPVPTLIGGDFNIMRHSKEKNKNNFNPRWPFLFNAVIDSFDLREIELTGRQFTWANSLSDPTFEKLDRVLMTTEWEFKYPLVTVHALDRGVSDHAPLYRGCQTVQNGAELVLP